ncbi:MULTISPECIES: TetR/AcrR family transcriptional regulator [unclassified Mycobacteroides]|uniref:TetR/AcrR family transcriptional regulator n=1 Tax=unclassified Mycobacteroides TaxID=2618759 RepID=UPI00132A2160|nr:MULTISPECIES: TetR/AcrR family transcriptional regulator [unclassified Mycobacteroides]MUM16997.1 hypothetical protein [Mycobacteroides sp. CBMA 326]
MSPPEPRIAAILDAALEQFAAVGFMKTSMADVARRAGVDRVTVYRTIGGAMEVRDAALTLAGLRMAAQIEESLVGIDDPAAKLEQAFVSMVMTFRSHPVLVKAMEVGRGEALDDLSQRSAMWLTSGAEPIVDILKTSRASGRGSVVDDADLASVVLRLLHSMVVFPDIGPAMTSEDDVRNFVRRAVVPLIIGQSPDSPK